MKPKKRHNVLESYTPSDELVAKTEALFDQYPPEEMGKRLRTLSRNMTREGEWLDEHATNPMSLMGVEASHIAAAANDLIEIGDTIMDIAKRKPLERRLVNDDSNAHLLLFEAYLPGLPTRIEKALGATSDWCSEKMDALDDRVDHMVAETQDKNTPGAEVKAIGQNLRFLDETMGMLHLIRQWADEATAEINKAKDKPTQRGMGAA
jgi:hypothetical protein